MCSKNLLVHDVEDGFHGFERILTIACIQLKGTTP